MHLKPPSHIYTLTYSTSLSVLCLSFCWGISQPSSCLLWAQYYPSIFCRKIHSDSFVKQEMVLLASPATYYCSTFSPTQCDEKQRKKQHSFVIVAFCFLSLPSALYHVLFSLFVRNLTHVGVQTSVLH